ncbi:MULTISPECIES: glycoside hydrolase N-terminal domain-containing protein [unclassified Streptococcus]|uniref:glycoside hydrolase family 95 protein n=1 Tax=unclassified Streptococcus TaxID=2608887 RepID=UPI0020C8BB76|nr:MULTISPECIES: glycoside hydrolase family 95 protein [unclassified Streptococcus]MCP9060192.1 glycoside hydrolase family 95 protein [Streptococcus sp. CF7_Ac1-12]MCP9084280.1 glycoside hydrolase family 95 protein [Streptococcus sp. CF7_Ac1-8]
MIRNKKQDYVLAYKQPASTTYKGWEEEALPIGNGSLGAKVFGLIGAERIQFNEKSLWSGGPLPDSSDYQGGNLQDQYVFLAEIRQALEKRDYNTAKELAEQHLVGPKTSQYGTYLSFGDIQIEFSQQGKTLSQVTDYQRQLNISKALATTSYAYKETMFKREAFTSFPDDLLVQRFTKEGSETLNFTMKLSLTRALASDGKYEQEKSDYKECQLEISPSHILMKGRVKDNDLQFASYLAWQTDGDIRVRSDKVQISGASYANLFLAAKTDFAQNPASNYRKKIDLAQQVKSLVETAKEKGYTQLKSRHIEDYQALFQRVQLDLGADVDTSTTDDLLKNYKPQEGQALEELFFQYGRYLLISSSRDCPDALPANLQGVWNAVDNPPWNSDYHLNINLQMNYWPAYVTNLLETAFPVINYIDDLRVYGRIAAARYAGIVSREGEENGWLVHTQATPFGWTAPGWDYYWGWSPAANAWMMQTVYEAYSFYRDQDYLREKIYPMLKETVRFWNAFLHKDQQAQRWVSSPSYSPEHGPISIGNTYDQSLIWQLFHDFIQAAQELGLDEDLLTEVKEKFDLLNPLQITQSGRIREWYEEEEQHFQNEKVEAQHRHASHLVGLYPGNLFSYMGQEYLEAARASLNDRGDGGTGWSKANKINLWARLGDGNRAHKLFAEQLKTSTLPNLWCTHPPFQIDGNFGATSGMAEMLLQSHAAYLVPLAALPDAWSSGSVSGLMARGHYEVSMRWADKKLLQLTILSRSGGDLRVSYPDIEKSVIKMNQEKIKAKCMGKDCISVATVEGDLVQFYF